MESSFATTRRPYFTEKNDGLASIEKMEAGYAGNFPQNQALFARNLGIRKGNLRNLNSFNGGLEGQKGHFLEYCYLCKKPIGGNSDIFMYRGDTPFCSEECRQEQIEIDEAKEITSYRSKHKKSSSSSPTKCPKYPYRTGTVAAA